MLKSIVIAVLIAIFGWFGYTKYELNKYESMYNKLKIEAETLREESIFLTNEIKKQNETNAKIQEKIAEINKSSRFDDCYNRVVDKRLLKSLHG